MPGNQALHDKGNHGNTSKGRAVKTRHGAVLRWSDCALVTVSAHSARIGPAPETSKRYLPAIMMFSPMSRVKRRDAIDELSGLMGSGQTPIWEHFKVVVQLTRTPGASTHVHAEGDLCVRLVRGCCPREARTRRHLVRTAFDG